MCDRLRYTVSRGRSWSPEIRFRKRNLIRYRRSCRVFILISSLSLRSRLPDFLLQHFAGVAHALLLVRIGLAKTPDVGGHLSNQLTVDAGHGDMGLLIDGDGDAGRHVEHDRVRVAEREDHLLAPHLRAIPDADDVELALEAFGDAEHAVGDQTARQPVELAELRIFAHGSGLQLSLKELEGHARRDPLGELALRSLDLERVLANFHRDALGHRDRFLSYT